MTTADDVETGALRRAADAKRAVECHHDARLLDMARERIEHDRARIAALTALVAALDAHATATATADAARAAAAVAALGAGGDVTLATRAMREHVTRREATREAAAAARRAVEALS